MTAGEGDPARFSFMCFMATFHLHRLSTAKEDPHPEWGRQTLSGRWLGRGRVVDPGSGLSERRLPWRQVRTSEQSVGLALTMPLDFPTLPSVLWPSWAGPSELIRMSQLFWRCYSDREHQNIP